MWPESLVGVERPVLRALRKMLDEFRSAAASAPNESERAWIREWAETTQVAIRVIETECRRYEKGPTDGPTDADTIGKLK